MADFSSKPLIAFLDQAETLGGSERFVLDFLNALSSSDYKRFPCIVIGAQNPVYRSQIPETIPQYKFSFPSVRGNIIQKFFHIFRILFSAIALKKRIQQYKVTLVFSNTPRTSFVFFFAKKIFRVRAKWVFMVHDFSIPAWILKSMAATADTIVVNSLATRHFVRKSIRSRDLGKIKIVENSIDCSSLPAPSPPKKIQKILMLGRIDPQKGQKYALEAADLLLERNPDLQFSIVGSPFLSDPRTMDYHNEILNFQKSRSLTNITWQDEVEKPFETISRHDCVLVLPTQPESFGRIVIESLALGKLVLVFSETGPREIIENYGYFLKRSVQDLLVQPRNAMSLAERIGFFADNPQEIDQYTQHGRTFVETFFSAQETKKRLLETFIHKK